MSNKSRRVILLAEDDADDRELFQEATAAFDHLTVHYCENGKEALRKIDELEIKPDLIFLDINMPVMTGWQCLKTLKDDARYKHIPVIIYSSSGHQREKDIAHELGADQFFPKPDNFFEFQKKLATILSENQQQSQE